MKESFLDVFSEIEPLELFLLNLENVIERIF